jgi:predicted SAM-dependent methyltransferase
MQTKYYTASAKDDAVILEYLAKLGELRALSKSGPKKRTRVHLGCGDHRLEGWWNADLLPSASTDVLANFEQALPFRSGSVDFLHSEDLLEHLSRNGGIAFLTECFRVLRAGGVMRLLTPDLRRLVEQVYWQRDATHLAWCDRELQASGPCEALNMHLRMNGDHRFVYDEEHLTATLQGIGFRVRSCRYNDSVHAELRYLDLRNFGLSISLEAEKPRT